jgi:hypothetical protein
MMTKTLSFALMFAVSTSTITVAAVATDTDAAAQPVKKKKAKKICKNSNGITGSRIAKRVCKTQEEWDIGEDGQEVGVKSKGGAIGN